MKSFLYKNDGNGTIPQHRRFSTGRLSASQFSAGRFSASQFCTGRFSTSLNDFDLKNTDLFSQKIMFL
ncbi:Hypothetical protein FKW44_024940 [Caligus rogercresseyi]|uniref:Uncharacterized protein n=1 Tax=Caligus rogercresseyi TaxID=217165 RepID=A0A7T8GKN4_CALRO|nr:Hypothetical protein FKW44_024940 [Caligus rogercresseyi]